METIQEKIIELTQTDNINNALNLIFTDYIKYKLYYLRNENNRFETKWGMTFNEFEKESPKMPNGMSYETEQEYYQWEAVITELEYFKNKLKK